MEQALEFGLEMDRHLPTAPYPAWNAAIDRHRNGDIEMAIAWYQRHLKRQPGDAQAWLNLGAALRTTRRMDAALVCYQRALRLCPEDAGIWSNLGNLWSDLELHEQALRTHRRALELQPGSQPLRVNYALALHEAARFEAAEEVLDVCVDEEPDRADLRHERAVVRLQRGRYREAWHDYAAGAAPLSPILAPRWNGERIGGKRLLLISGTSCGDLLWATRYLPLLISRGCELSLACPRALHPVLTNLPARLVEPTAETFANRRYDYHAPLLSLPGLADPCGLAIPEPMHAAVPEDSMMLMGPRIAPYLDQFKIGIAWSGSAGSAATAKRAVALERFLPLAALPDVQLFSMQKGPPAEAIKTLGASGFVVDLGVQFRHFGDTAAALQHLDLVVTTDCVVAHLAACLGKPVLNLLQFKPSWIYGMSRDVTPWYPSMRLLRQSTPGNWDGVFTELHRLVRGWAENRTRAPRPW